MAETKKVPQRSEIPEQYTWNTADLFPSDEAWQAAYDEAQDLIPTVAAYAGRLGESAATLYQYLEDGIALERKMDLLMN